MLKPINGNVLVKLAESLEYVDTPDKQYATKTSGLVVAVEAPGPAADLLGSIVYFADFKDGSQVVIEDEIYAFIDYADIKGYQDV